MRIQSLSASIFIYLLSCLSLTAQNLIECPDTKAVWQVEGGKESYVVRIPATTQKSGYDDQVSIKDDVVVCLVLDKRLYLPEKGQKYNDDRLLQFHANDESGLIGLGDFKSEWVKLKNGDTALFWQGSYPVGESSVSQHSIHITKIIGNNIIWLTSPQYPDNNYEEERLLLIAMITSAKALPDGEDPCSL